MLNDIAEFFITNWQALVVAFLVSATFFFLSGILSKKYYVGAQNERIIQAKENMLDILESKIINKQDITDDKIKELLRAMGRKYSVNLYGSLSSTSLLEDLQLRFEQSHHLDPTQKEDYCKLIGKYLEKIKMGKKKIEIPRKYEEIFDSMENHIKSDNKDMALKDFVNLKKKIKEREEILENPFLMQVQLFKKYPWVIVIAVLFYIAIFILIVYF